MTRPGRPQRWGRHSRYCGTHDAIEHSTKRSAERTRRRNRRANRQARTTRRRNR